MLSSAARGSRRRAARSKMTRVSIDPPATMATQRTAVSGPLARGSTLLSTVAISNEAAIGPRKMPKRSARLSPVRLRHRSLLRPPPKRRRVNWNPDSHN